MRTIVMFLIVSGMLLGCGRISYQLTSKVDKNVNVEIVSIDTVFLTFENSVFLKGIKKGNISNYKFSVDTLNNEVKYFFTLNAKKRYVHKSGTTSVSGYKPRVYFIEHDYSNMHDTLYYKKDKALKINRFRRSLLSYHILYVYSIVEK